MRSYRNLIIIMAVISIAAIFALISRTNQINDKGAGIRGTASIGPTCPVSQATDSAKCADRPYAGSFIVYLPDGQNEITSFRSGEDGKFQVSISPGTYRIASSSNPTGLPRFLGPQTVTVYPGRFSDVTFKFDSGIR